MWRKMTGTTNIQGSPQERKTALSIQQGPCRCSSPPFHVSGYTDPLWWQAPSHALVRAVTVPLPSKDSCFGAFCIACRLPYHPLLRLPYHPLLFNHPLPPVILMLDHILSLLSLRACYQGHPKIAPGPHDSSPVLQVLVSLL